MIPFAFLGLDTLSDAGAITDTLELTDLAEYALISYAPGIAPRRASRLANQSRYAEVADRLAVDVLGGTAVSCVQACERLMDRLQQAARWWGGESVEAVQIRMRVQGGTAGDLTAIIYGPSPDQAPAQISPQFDSALDRWIIRDVQLSFVRRGLLRGTTPEIATSTATAQSVTGACTFAEDAALPTPTKVRFVPSGQMGDDPGYIIIAAKDGIQSVNAAAYTGGAGVAKVVDTTTNLSVSGTVVQITAPTAGSFSVPITSVSWKAIALFAMVRVNTAGGEWTITANVRRGGSDGEDVRQVVRYQYDPVASRSSAFPVLLGVLSSDYGFNTFIDISVTGNTGTMDMDTLHMVRVDLPANIVTATFNVPYVGMQRTTTFVAQIDPHDRDRRQPRVDAVDIGTEAFAYAYSYNGDVFITSSGDGLSFLLLEPGFQFKWREGSGTTPYTTTLTATRYPVYLTPQ